MTWAGRRDLRLGTGAPVFSQQSSDADLGTIKRFYNASDQTNPFDNLISGIAYVNGIVYTGSNRSPVGARLAGTSPRGL